MLILYNRIGSSRGLVFRRRKPLTPKIEPSSPAALLASVEILSRGQIPTTIAVFFSGLLKGFWPSQPNALLQSTLRRDLLTSAVAALFGYYHRVNPLRRMLILAMASVSGAATLAYQIVWIRRLAVVFGSTPLASGTRLITLFAGVAIGTWVWGRVADRRQQSALVIWAALQIASGFYGVASLWFIHGIEFVYSRLYPMLAGNGIGFATMQCLLMAAATLPQVILISGVLPLLTRYLVWQNEGIVYSVGAVFGWTVLGAAGSAAATTFGLLPTIGLVSTALWATTASIVMGATVLILHKHSPKSLVSANVAPSIPRPVTSDKGMVFLVLLGLAVSGFTAIAFEVSWDRLLAMVFGSSIYAHGTLLVVVLSGLGMGSVFYSVAKRGGKEQERRFAALQWGAAFSAALSIAVLPWIPFLFWRYFSLLRIAFHWQIISHFAGAILVVIAPCLFLGAILPAAIASLGNSAVYLGRTIGRAYLAISIGIIVGVFMIALIVPTVGLRAAMTSGVIAAVLVGFAVWWRSRVPRRLSLKILATPTSALLIVGILAAWPRAWPRTVFVTGIGVNAPSYGKEALASIVSGMRLLYYRDGMSSTSSVDDTAGTLSYRLNGKIEGATDPVAITTQLLLGHLPMLLHKGPRDVFVFGLGTGITAAAVARYPVQQIDVVEPNATASQAVRFFNSYTGNLLNDPRVRLIIGDGRSRLRGMGKQYDVVISAPSDVWEVGNAPLYTLDFYRTVSARLRPGGIFVQAVDIHGLLPGDLKLLAATFGSVFPHMQIWTSAPANLIFLGNRDSTAWNYIRLRQHFDHTQGVADDLRASGIWTPFALFGAQILGENGSAVLTRDFDQLQTDNHPVLEFRAPRSFYVDTVPLVVDELSRLVLTGAPAIAGFDPQRDLDAQGAYLLGFAYAFTGRPELAIPYMERSTQLAPQNAAFFVGLGNEYRAAGHPAAAARTYERALALDLNNVEALVSLGEIRLDQGQLDWTRVLAGRALRLAPQNVRVHSLVGRLQDAAH